MKKLIFFFVSFTIGFNYSSTAQNYFDCIDAYEVCGNEGLTFQYDSIVGSVDENLENLCMNSVPFIDFQSNTIWLKYQFQSGGDFVFKISPSDWTNDLDFVAFKSPSGNCDNLSSIRCMFSGENVGGAIDTICLGSTGLSFNSVDDFEDGGCNNGSDNFLAPIDVNADDIIYLAIFSGNQDFEYTVAHAGSATLINCQTLSTEETKKESLQFYPNPIRNELSINDRSGEEDQIKVEVLNSNGYIFFEKTFTKSMVINMENFPPGVYYIRTLKNDVFFIKKLIKIK